MSDKRGIDAFVVYKCISPVGDRFFPHQRRLKG